MPIINIGDKVTKKEVQSVSKPKKKLISKLKQIHKQKPNQNKNQIKTKPKQIYKSKQIFKKAKKIFTISKKTISKPRFKSKKITKLKTRKLKKKSLPSGSSKKLHSSKKEIQSSKYSYYAGKEFFHKIGSGLVSQQFINVLFSQIGASYFIIGMFHGLRELLSMLFAIFIQEYIRVRNLGKKFLAITALILGLSYILLAIGLITQTTFLVGATLVLGGICLTILGNMYAKNFVQDAKENPNIKLLPRYGIILIGFAMIFSAIILDKYPIYGQVIQITSTFGLPGYFILIALASICFVISSLLMLKLLRKQDFEIKSSLTQAIKDHLEIIIKNTPKLLKNKIILISLIAGTMTGLVQTLGNIYYGLYIFKIFQYVGFGGFTNIAMIFIIAIFSALMSTTISKMLSKKYGNLPLLVFGTLLVAIQPLAYYFSPNLLSISMATIAGIIGASLTGLAIGLLVTHNLSLEDRKLYYNVFSFLITIPYLIFIPFGSYIAQKFGLSKLFLILALILIFIVMPLYFALEVYTRKQMV